MKEDTNNTNSIPLAPTSTHPVEDAPKQKNAQTLMSVTHKMTNAAKITFVTSPAKKLATVPAINPAKTLPNQPKKNAPKHVPPEIKCVPNAKPTPNNAPNTKNLIAPKNPATINIVLIRNAPINNAPPKPPTLSQLEPKKNKKRVS